MKTKLSVVQLVCISTAIYPTTVFINIRTGPYKIVTICSTKQLIFSTLKTQNYNPIKTHQPLSNTTQQHVQTSGLEHGKPKSHLLLLFTPELHPVTDAAAHVVSRAGEICWSRCKCGVATQGVFFFFFLGFDWILEWQVQTQKKCVFFFFFFFFS